jgi:hypothetical protein
MTDIRIVEVEVDGKVYTVELPSLRHNHPDHNFLQIVVAEARRYAMQHNPAWGYAPEFMDVAEVLGNPESRDVVIRRAREVLGR